MNTLIVTSSIIAASIFLLLGLFVFFIGTKNQANRAFSIYFIVISVFSFGIYGLAGSIQPLDFWLKLLAVGVVFIPWSYLNFLDAILKSKNRQLTYFSLLLSISFFLLVFTKLLYKGVKPVEYGFVGDPGLLFPLYIVFVVITLTIGQRRLAKKIKYETSAASKKNFQLIHRAFWIFWIGSLMPVPTILGFHFLGGVPVWNFTSIVYGILITMSVVKYDAIELEVNLEKTSALLRQIEDKNTEILQINSGLEIQIKEEVEKREQAMEIAQDLASQALFSQVAKGIAHEIRNPIEAIRGSAEDMQDYFILEPSDDLKFYKQDLGDALFLELVKTGFVLEDGTLSTTKLLFGKQRLILSDAYKHLEPELTEKIQAKQRKIMLLSCSSVIISESERIVRIADDMLKFGTSGKGIPKDCFVNVIPGLQSEDIWHHLKSKGYLTANGYLTLLASSCDYYVQLDVPYSNVASEIRSVLKTFKTAQIESVKLCSLLHHFYALHHRYLESKGIGFVIHEIDDSICILGREDELMRCFMNIVKNAEQSLERVVGKKEIQISVQANLSGGVCIEIQDTGCGIPKEHLDKVKDAFFTTKDPAGGKNVGLGLAFVTRIIEGYGGKVDIESEIGSGTRIQLTISR